MKDMRPVFFTNGVFRIAQHDREGEGRKEGKGTGHGRRMRKTTDSIRLSTVT
jgi:hypothetical protein